MENDSSCETKLMTGFQRYCCGNDILLVVLKGIGTQSEFTFSVCMNYANNLECHGMYVIRRLETGDIRDFKF